ncbi:hypothetical protein EHW99_1873 [Erwinia amylovora]|uniref:Uncharacterized protein n=2 Tax=Erwinia amylovora TaxID=552 RepID=A0A831A2N1_ERWAM|nr:hypothetical protein EaACW_1716 [Erwinia amylovora ACW56400]QJQ54577.1 hypothetical protein EHX00_1873 [Erwinia amylovora]CBA20661.1 hypothetical protein predicted by Glimmer/Critica [Erwinia amylovora CFBP1430]CCO78564.1 hypothetical protein BN432_1766 [Erwinia amylovora Ea356]CCO82359.1 hypothetical protein BN433_1789 [Erwinia amylovora Ea266]CCO86145.1 hypothetical protein BN434_1757 [Erwinia amylovora CFBP 2585]CCO89933.1 hypothetical protein BN435_1762 [Erwinia amylovora 01SFR-BO]CCO
MDLIKAQWLRRAEEVGRELPCRIPLSEVSNAYGQEPDEADSMEGLG